MSRPAYIVEVFARGQRFAWRLLTENRRGVVVRAEEKGSRDNFGEAYHAAGELAEQMGADLRLNASDTASRENYGLLALACEDWRERESVESPAATIFL